MEMVEKYGFPEEFVQKMQILLGEEANPFFESLKGERQYGLRLNPLKVDGMPEFLCNLDKVF